MKVMGMGSRLQTAMSAMLTVVAPLLMITACSSGETDSTPTSVLRTSATSTVTATTTAAAQDNSGSPSNGDDAPARPGNPAGQQPNGPANEPPKPPPGGTDNCGASYCGEPMDNCTTENCGPLPDDNYVKCTDRINYAGDPRSNAEINIIGEREGKCPTPIRPTPTTRTTTKPPTPTPAVTPSPSSTPRPTSSTR